MAKIRNFDSFGAVLQHFCPDKREIWQGGRSPMPNFTFIGATCRPCGGKQSTFGPLSKKNTGMAALRTGLPVMKRKLGSGRLLPYNQDMSLHLPEPIRSK